MVFLELKTHHEKWIENNSVKERCGIREKFVPTLLDVSSGKWDMQTAYDIVRISNPSESKESMLKLTRVLLQIRKLICKFKFDSVRMN
jgi:SPX domain protein involved in polyphosphate accumulation